MARVTHWHILGAGSLGCLWAFNLHKAGHAVTLIAKDALQLSQLQSSLPLRLIEAEQEHSCNVDIIDAEQTHVIEHLLICLKAYQTHDALKKIQPVIPEAATIILMQNGMGNQQQLLDLFTKQALYAAISTEAACRIGPLHVEHTGKGITQLGCLSNRQDIELPEKLECALQISLKTNIEESLWQKLVINCCINPLTTIYQCKNGELANIAQAQLSIEQIINECRRVANAVNKAHYLNDIEIQVANVIKETAKNTSSMLQDFLNRQPTEIDYMNGYIVNLARKNGIDTPENISILKTIKEYQSTYNN